MYGRTLTEQDRLRRPHLINSPHHIRYMGEAVVEAAVAEVAAAEAEMLKARSARCPSARLTQAAH